MQSGISVSPELHDAFTTFCTDASIFCLPVTIDSERLCPLTPLRFSTSSSTSASSATTFYNSLPQLSSVLEPKTPLYLLLRRPEHDDESRHSTTTTTTSPSPSPSSLIALTYIPSNAPVRAKTLFASTRTTLVRELGSEKFSRTVFATEEEEVFGEDAWREREDEDAASSGAGAGGAASRSKREELMGEKERELEAVRRAEEEARSGTPSRDIGIGGSFGGNGDVKGSSAGLKMEMRVDDEARVALRELRQGGMVQLAIDVKTETMTLAASESNVDAGAVGTHISASSPRYTFYHYPDSEVVIFIYTCPSGSSIKERMLYASTRASALQLAQNEGLKVSKKIEASSPDEVSGARLQEEVNPTRDDGPKRGFARPRRPGR